jgi:hypothetical protein
MVYSQVSPTVSALPHIPEIGELGQEWSRHIFDRPVSDIWEEIVDEWKGQNRPRSHEEGKKHGGWDSVKVWYSRTIKR